MSPVTTEYLGVSTEAIQHHYDIGNGFYGLWLDPSMTYSCALWEAGDTLETAQIRQIDYHIQQSQAAGGRRVLDIGCGWGSTLKRLVETHGVERAVGLNLSQTQIDFVRSWHHPAIEVRMESWADHTPTEPYDAIIAVEVLDHCAKTGLSQEEQVAVYRHFFESCHRLLKPGGYLSLQVGTYGNLQAGDLDKIDPEILADMLDTEPEADMPYPADVIAAITPHFELIRLRNDRQDFLQTHQAWLEQLQTNRQAAIAIAGEKTVSQFERYLQYTLFALNAGATQLLRLTLRRVDRPWYEYLG